MRRIAGGKLARAAWLVGAASGRRLALGLMLGLALGLAGGARAQAPGVDEQTLREAERAAERAEEAAAAARAFAEALRAEADPPRAEGTAAAEPNAEDPAAADPAAPDTDPLAAAVARAEAAADAATRAARRVADAERDARLARGRTGPYVGGAFLYAAENFDDSIVVKSSTGGAAFLGYRLDRFFALEVRYEGFEGFDLRGATGRAEIDGYAISAIGRVLPLDGPIQPFASIGFGGLRLEQKTVFADGSRRRSGESDAAFRFGAGIDLWLGDHAVLNLEAAYLGPFDELSDLDMTLLSSGLTWRF